MSKRKFALLKRREEFQSHYTVLDIGTEFVKALIVKREGDKGIVLGVGKVRQAQSHMQAGAVADLQAVIDNCDRALTEAEDMCETIPGQAVIGIAGEQVRGFSTTMTVPRPQPQARITQADLATALQAVQRRALREAVRQMSHDLGVQEVNVKLVHSTITSVRIDGYAVSQPRRLPGACRRDHCLQHVRAAHAHRRAPGDRPGARSRARRDGRGAVRPGARLLVSGIARARRDLRRRRRRDHRHRRGPAWRDRGDPDVRARRTVVHQAPRHRSLDGPRRSRAIQGRALGGAPRGRAERDGTAGSHPDRRGACPGRRAHARGAGRPRPAPGVDLPCRRRRRAPRGCRTAPHPRLGGHRARSPARRP